MSDIPGQQQPEVNARVPGPNSRSCSERLKDVECRGITYAGEDFPVFWERALGCNVWDVDGNRFVDLTAAFGVASCGHSHPDLAAVASKQSETLLHGMGDVHPPRVKLDFLERLQASTPGDLTGAILGQNGADAVEAALKAAYLHTNRPGIIAFGSAYHGLSGMALEVTDFDAFRGPFSAYMGNHVKVFPYPASDEALKELWAVLDDWMADNAVGAILAEPIQGRGGVVIPPEGFLQGLRQRADGVQTVLILDEIYTGFSRTGKAFACDWAGVVPDLLCLGKALTGGFPLSVTVGLPHVMESWPVSTGEAIHTSTFLGNPVGCALASRSLELHQELNLAERAQRLGDWALNFLQNKLKDCSWVVDIRGRGMMLGIECIPYASGMPRAVDLMGKMLQRGYITLPSGPESHVLSLSPPLVITEGQWEAALNHVVELLLEMD